MIEIIAGLALLFLATTVQGRLPAILLSVAAGWLIHGGGA